MQCWMLRNSREKYFSLDSEYELRGKNGRKEIAPRRSNLSTYKKRCNAVTTLIIAAPLRIIDRNGKRWSRRNLYNAPLILMQYFCVRILNRINCAVIFAPFRSVRSAFTRLSLKSERKPISCGWLDVWNFTSRRTEDSSFDSRYSIRY